MFAAFGGPSRHLEQPEFLEQTAHIGRTKTGTGNRGRAMKCTIGVGVVAVGHDASVSYVVQMHYEMKRRDLRYVRRAHLSQIEQRICRKFEEQ